jgi:hypothetical protein
VLEASFEVSFDTVAGLFRVSMLGLCVRACARVLEASFEVSFDTVAGLFRVSMLGELFVSV